MLLFNLNNFHHIGSLLRENIFLVQHDIQTKELNFVLFLIETAETFLIPRRPRQNINRIQSVSASTYHTETQTNMSTLCETYQSVKLFQHLLEISTMMFSHIPNSFYISTVSFEMFPKHLIYQANRKEIMILD